ncbi:MAG TPA: trypsin-like peptidase domain-containing protein [Pyrinomonadaceae bacterium]|jgi:Flp pilus assembly protein TadD|nr:trypsin-like peptidase domain-containing protein [Pyrinomonadaceae bacterium]
MPKSQLPPTSRRLPLLLLLLCLFASGFAATAQAQQSPTESLPELVRRVKPSVVAIVTYDAKGEPLLSGSGFFIRPGQVLTNLHVVEGARRVEVKTLDGKGRIYASQGALDFDEEADLAVLSVDVPQERTRVIELTNNLPEEGEGVFVIGNPLRLEGSISDGIVSAVREVPNLGKIIQTTAPISHGNSGSPVFNYRGQVVGIVTIKVTNGQNINLALASARLASLKPDHLTSYDALAARNRNTPGGEASAEWWYKNGLNSLWLGNYDGALGSFEQVVNKNPNRVEAWIQVGYCKVKQGKMSDAIRAYKQALRLRPNSVEAYNKLGDAYYYASNFEEAVAAYRQAARLRPDLGEALYNLGMTYLELGDRNAALAQSRLLQPLDAELYQKLLNEFRR